MPYDLNKRYKVSPLKFKDKVAGINEDVPIALLIGKTVVLESQQGGITEGKLDLYPKSYSDTEQYMLPYAVKTKDKAIRIRMGDHLTVLEGK